MRSYRETLTFTTPGRVAFVNITADVEKAVKASGVREGLCLVNAMHITAAIFINDSENGLHRDNEVRLEKYMRKKCLRIRGRPLLTV